MTAHVPDRTTTVTRIRRERVESLLPPCRQNARRCSPLQPLSFRRGIFRRERLLIGCFVSTRVRFVQFHPAATLLDLEPRWTDQFRGVYARLCLLKRAEDPRPWQSCYLLYARARSHTLVTWVVIKRGTTHGRHAPALCPGGGCDAKARLLPARRERGHPEVRLGNGRVLRDDVVVRDR